MLPQKPLFVKYVTNNTVLDLDPQEKGKKKVRNHSSHLAVL